MNRKLLNVYSTLATFVRQKGYIGPGGIRYPGGIIYYPRHPDHKDPDYTPTKLFRIERIKSPKHNTWRVKKILQNFNILEENRVNIVKNIPSVNAKLWKVKHLIKITPIHFPYGEPTEEDIKYTVLKENGMCIVSKKLEPNSTELEALDSFDNNRRKMNSTTIKKDSRRKWLVAYGGGF